MKTAPIRTKKPRFEDETSSTGWIAAVDFCRVPGKVSPSGPSRRPVRAIGHLAPEAKALTANGPHGLASVAQVLGAERPFFTPVMIPLTIVDWVWAPVSRSKIANELVPDPPLSHQTGTRPAVVVSWA